MSKFAAFVGNMHASARVTPFFASPLEARQAAAKTEHGSTVVREISNWKEHMKWNAERFGMYECFPVAE